MDRYASFYELARTEVLDEDYAIESLDRQSEVIVVAPQPNVSFRAGKATIVDAVTPDRKKARDPGFASTLRRPGQSLAGHDSLLGPCNSCGQRRPDIPGMSDWCT